MIKDKSVSLLSIESSGSESKDFLQRLFKLLSLSAAYRYFYRYPCHGALV